VRVSYFVAVFILINWFQTLDHIIILFVLIVAANMNSNVLNMMQVSKMWLNNLYVSIMAVVSKHCNCEACICDTILS
jgi:hypothetical protein